MSLTKTKKTISLAKGTRGIMTIIELSLFINIQHKKALTLSGDHLSMYQLSLEKSTPYGITIDVQQASSLTCSPFFLFFS